MAARDSGGSVASWLSGAAVAAFGAGPLGAHFGLVPARIGFLVFVLGGVLGLCGVIAAVIGLLRGRAPRAALRALLVGGAVSLVFVLLTASARSAPVINDVTTDSASPPRFVAAAALPANRGRDLAYPGPAVAALQAAAYPDIRPLRLQMPVTDAFARVEAAVRRLPRVELIRVDPAAHVIEGVATSRVFRFQDDFVVEVRTDGNGSVVEMRSKSRDGRSDLGVNAARIRQTLALIQGPSA
jgi:uncharacterized protein (DUF1499 family)